MCAPPKELESFGSMRLIRRCLITGNIFNEILRHSETTPSDYRLEHQTLSRNLNLETRIEIWSVSKRIIFKFGMKCVLMGIR